MFGDSIDDEDGLVVKPYFLKLMKTEPNPRTMLYHIDDLLISIDGILVCRCILMLTEVIGDSNFKLKYWKCFF